ncbi:MAG: OmpL47-type beta-barrel domain-containing protein, partial [Thermoplasmatota archaeon]
SDADPSNDVHQAAFTVVSPNQPPVANFTYHPSYPTTASMITFADQSSDADGSIVNWTWSFGDGNVSYEQHPHYRYPDAGTYTVTLTVTDDDGASDTCMENISVRVPSPPPNPPTPPSLPDSDKLIYFDGPAEWNRTHWDVVAGTLICVDMDVARSAGLTSLYYRVDDGSWERWTECICSCAMSPGMHSIYYYGVDAHGRHTNTARIVINVVTSVAPVTTCDVYPPHPAKYTGWYTDAVTIRLDAVDGVSGVSGTYYRFNEGNWLTYTESIVVATDGRYTLEYYSVDNAGNEEAVQSNTFKIDKTSPSLTFKQPSQGHLYLMGREILPLKHTVVIGPATLAVDAGDDTAGIEMVEFYIDDELQKTVTDEPFELVWDEPAFWKHTIQAIAVDQAGNRATVEQEIWIFNI